MENTENTNANTENVNTDQSIDAIPIVEPAQAFDATQYEGAKVKIARVEQITFESHYIDGKYDADNTKETPAIEIETESIGDMQTDDGPKPITVNARFNLQEKVIDGKKQIVISKHPKASLWKFLRKMGCQRPSELMGKIVVITTEASKDESDDRRFLRIVK